MKLRRPELLLCALFAAILGQFAQAFWPLQPDSATAVRGLLWGLGLLCALTATRPRPTPPEPSERRPLAARLAFRALQIALGALLVLILGRMHASGYVTAFIVSPPACITGGLIEVLGLVACAWFGWKRRPVRPAALAVGSSLLFTGSILFVLLTTWMWRPPEPQACEDVIRPGVVQRLSPAGWPAEPSQPYSLLYIPEKGWLMAAFKMAGSTVLSFWDEPSANRVLGVDISDPSTATVVPFPGLKLPLHMAYQPSRQELLVARTGPGTHSLDVLDLGDLPAMPVTRSTGVAIPPNGLISYPSADAYAVLGQHGDFSLVTADGLGEVYRLFLGLKPEHVAMTLDAWRIPGTSKVVASVLMYPMVEIDMATRNLRWSDEMFGGGQLSGEAGLPEVFLTDMLFSRVHVLALDSLQVTRTLELEYTPRAVQVDTSRDLLMVGDWFDGVVRFYRLSTLEALAHAVPVGPYLRDLALDAERGLLFAATKCGVYQVTLDAVLSGD